MRFVILEHDHPVLHWDLMLEAGDVLQTWRLAQPPESVGCAIAATPLGDHRVMYLDYEGPVSGDRGTVIRWDAGEFSEEAAASLAVVGQAASLAKPEASEAACPTTRLLVLRGKRVSGRVRLKRINEAAWRFVWLSD